MTNNIRVQLYFFKSVKYFYYLNKLKTLFATRCSLKYILLFCSLLETNDMETVRMKIIAIQEILIY